MKRVLILIFIIVAVVGGGMIFFGGKETEITNFEECAQAGNPIMESYPRQCAARGEVFVEKIQEDTVRALYACKDGKTIDVTFYNGMDERADLILDDRLFISLPRAISASGARYATHDESVVFWNKGNTAFILESTRETYKECVEYPGDAP